MDVFLVVAGRECFRLALALDTVVWTGVGHLSPEIGMGEFESHMARDGWV